MKFETVRNYLYECAESGRLRDGRNRNTLAITFVAQISKSAFVFSVSRVKETRCEQVDRLPFETQAALGPLRVNARPFASSSHAVTLSAGTRNRWRTGTS